MAATTERPQIELRGLKRRGGVRAAVLVLEGSNRTDVKRTCALTGMLSDRCMLVAVDGGLKTCLAARRHPDLFIGDGDSSGDVPADLTSVVYPEDKDFSDLAGALEEMRRRKVQIIGVAGLVGGRLDHEWANMYELAASARSFAGIVAPTDRGTIVITRHGCQAATVRRRTLSLFSLTPTSTVTLRGPRWELERKRLRPGSLGLSNVTGSEVDLTVHAGTVALIFMPRAGRGRRDKA